MAHNSNAPTHTWLIGNGIMRFFGWCFLVLLLVTFLVVSMARMSILRGCPETTKRDIKWAGLAVHVEASAAAVECPGHDG